MPTTSEELHAAWDDTSAVDFILESGGRIMGFFIDLPADHTNKMFDAAQYLIEEWDYGMFSWLTDEGRAELEEELKTYIHTAEKVGNFWGFGNFLINEDEYKRLCGNT